MFFCLPSTAVGLLFSCQKVNQPVSWLKNIAGLQVCVMLNSVSEIS